jgi:hypothetical protein
MPYVLGNHSPGVARTTFIRLHKHAPLVGSCQPVQVRLMKFSFELVPAASKRKPLTARAYRRNIALMPRQDSNVLETSLLDKASHASICGSQTQYEMMQQPILEEKLFSNLVGSTNVSVTNGRTSARAASGCKCPSQ